MATAVRLRVITGPHKDATFCFFRDTTCQVGRATDCQVCLCGAERDQQISRHHCELDISLPEVRVRDLGSLNGTYVNGHPVNATEVLAATANLLGGQSDILTIGGTSMKVEIVDCPRTTDGSDRPTEVNCATPC